MSTESSKSLKRQWHIIWYLLNGVYVSTTNIRDYLATLGIETELRTIQRDLVLLENIFPLECRRESMPHSWRWKKPVDTEVGGLSLSQALTIRLVEEQLHNVMSPKMLQELQPLFMKARLVTGMDGREGAMLAKKVCKPLPVFGAVVSSTGILPEFWTVLAHSLNPFRERQGKELEEALRRIDRVLREEGFEDLLSIDSLHFLSTTRLL